MVKDFRKWGLRRLSTAFSGCELILVLPPEYREEAHLYQWLLTDHNIKFCAVDFRAILTFTCNGGLTSHEAREVGYFRVKIIAARPPKLDHGRSFIAEIARIHPRARRIGIKIVPHTLADA